MNRGEIANMMMGRHIKRYRRQRREGEKRLRAILITFIIAFAILTLIALWSWW